MAEFQELIKDAPKFDLMERGELVAYAYGMFAAGTKMDAENSKLREQLAKARDPQRIGGTADPESFVYAIEQLREFRWQHATNDEDAIPYINNVVAAHERENAKLREELDAAKQDLQVFSANLARLGSENAKLRKLVKAAYRCIRANVRCEECRLVCSGCTLQTAMRELGIEVDDGVS